MWVRVASEGWVGQNSNRGLVPNVGRRRTGGRAVVFLVARWAARLTHGSPMIRATLVGLAPGAFLGWMIVERDHAILTGARFKLWAVLAWSLLNLGGGVVAGLQTRRRHERDTA